jgi:hypothetical protein
MENQRRTIMWLLAAIVLVVGLDAYLFIAEVFKNQ